jgi:hypothetical protein
MAKQTVCSPWNGKPGCGAPITWVKVQQADGTVKNVMFNAGTQIMHLPTCAARQQTQAPVQQAQQQFAPQQQTINPFAPAPVAAPQQQPAEQQGPDTNDEIVEGLAAINTTLTNGLLAIFKELRPDNQDSMLAVLVQNTGLLIEMQKPAAMIADAAAPPAPETPTQAPENAFEVPKKETKKK